MSITVSSTMRPKPDFAAATALTHLAMAPSTTIEEVIPVEDDDQEFPEKNNDEDETEKSFRGKNAKFPMKLMLLLDSEEYADIMEWTPHGRSFVIKNQEAFAFRVLHHHFKAGKYSSFVRKLYRWGFSRILRGDNHGAFYNENFLKGKYKLCRQIKACHARSPEVTYNLRKKIEDRNKIAVLPFLLDQGNASSTQLPSYRMAGASNSLNTAYQPILSRAPDSVVPPCNNLPHVSCSPSPTFPVNNALLSMALANSMGLTTQAPLANSLGFNLSRPTNLGLHSSIPTNTAYPYDGTISHLINSATHGNLPNASEVEKVKKAMELIVALGL